MQPIPRHHITFKKHFQHKVAHNTTVYFAGMQLSIQQTVTLIDNDYWTSFFQAT